jgi:hypothetical protein
MFSLIISIISIALVAALAAATVYFGGAAFNKGSAGADASAFINAGQQIAGAFTLAAADGYTATTVASLQNASLGATSAGNDGQVYLSQVPAYKGSNLTTLATSSNKSFVSAVVSDQVCREINDRALGKGATGPSGIGNVDLFGCVTETVDGTSTSTAYYKVK